MKITKENLAEYLLTLMLVNAGYQITFDEVLEDTMVKSYLDKDYRWYLEYTQTVEQSREWYKEAVQITKKVHKISEQYAMGLVAELDLHCGLTLKG
jgi:transcriptional antiterminator